MESEGSVKRGFGKVLTLRKTGEAAIAASPVSLTVQRAQIPASLRMSGTLDSQPWAMMCTPWQ